MQYFLKIFSFLIIIFYTNIQLANEILLYADSIQYDSEQNIIAKGNVKIIKNNQIITSDLIIYNQLEKKYILPIEFNFNDGNKNYYNGSSGEFSEDLINAKILDVKLLLNDGSRIVGKEAIRNGKIDIITKGSYSPCTSRINFKSFLCPIWQLDGEKILHDGEDLFLYQKHSKMKIFNLPVFYIPYLVTPSPLRKDRKSGFLSPKMKFNFLDTKVSQTTSFPYYFNISIDKELTFTPVLNYGGGVDSSQRLLFDYNQKISGGSLSLDLSLDTKLEKQNNEKWLQNGSIITNYNQNINENTKLNITSAFQTSPTYIKTSDPDNKLSYQNSLSTSLDLEMYNIKTGNDVMNFNISSYQVIKNNEDNKTSPTALPHIKYDSGYQKYNQYDYKNKITYYNIFRDISTADHSQKQHRLTHYLEIINKKYSYNSLINFKLGLHNQFYKVTNKKIDNQDINSDYYRIFPTSGIFIETPLKNIKNNIIITPKISFIINSGQSNSDRISNEESTNNAYNIETQNELNRYTGIDKLDNSKRINYGINIIKNNFEINLSQNYEFEKNSNYHEEMGNDNYLSDLLGNFSYDKNDNKIIYQYRYNVHINEIRKQQVDFSHKGSLGSIKAIYLDEKKETNSILIGGNETFKINYESLKFKKYSQLKFNATYDLINDKENEYSLGYSYFDECFGINIDFKRSFYDDRELKPNDSLLLMFSFKNLGSYQSSNLAVSEIDKQDIEWVTKSIENDLFN